jgi:MarC family membrane protein
MSNSLDTGVIGSGTEVLSMTLHNLTYMFVSAFLALFPVVNPISDGMIIDRYLSGLSVEERKLIVRKITLNCIFVGIATLILGHFVLLLFGLAVPVIQLGGGVLICQVGLAGLSGSGDTNEPSLDTDANEHEADRFKRIRGETFYPLSFPISLGPGTISVIFALMANSSWKSDFLKTFVSYGIIGLAIIILCALIYICCLQGQKIIERLGNGGMEIINKLVSFLTFCVGLQIVVTGISDIFHLHIL